MVTHPCLQNSIVFFFTIFWAKHPASAEDFYPMMIFIGSFPFTKSHHQDDSETCLAAKDPNEKTLHGFHYWERVRIPR